MLSKQYISRMLTEEIRRVIREDESELGVSSSSDVSSAINNSDAKADENGGRKFGTSVSNLNGKNDGAEMEIKAKSPSEAQAKLNQNKAQNPSFYNNPANRVKFNINSSGRFN